MLGTADTRWRTDDEGNLVIPQDQSDFLDWLLSDVRDPPNQQQWAHERGYNVRTVKSWKHDPRFKREWERRAADKNISIERIQDVVNTIYNAAKNGDVKASEAYLKYIERFLPAPERVTSDQSIRAMSDEELDAALKELV